MVNDFIRCICCLLAISAMSCFADDTVPTLETGGFQIALPQGWERLNQPTNFFVQQRARNTERNMAIGAGSHHTDLPLDQYIVVALAGFESGPEPQFEKLSKLAGVSVPEVEKILQSQVGAQLLQKVKQAYRSMQFEVLDLKKVEISGALAYELHAKTTILESGGVFFTRQFTLAGDLPGEIVEITFAGPEDIFRDNSVAGAIRKKASSTSGAEAFDFYNGGIAKGQKGDFAGAVNDFSKAIELKPDYAEAYCKRGMSKGALARSPNGDLSSILSDYDKAIKLKPDYAEAYYNRAVLEQVKDDKKGALADYDKVIELNPGIAKAYYNRGAVRAASSDRAGAMDDYNKALELDPNAAPAYRNRALLKYVNGDANGAITDFDKALGIAPNDYQTYERRGDAKKAKGDAAGAQADYQTARELKARNSRAQ